jgi:hypothetical protein
MQYNIYLSEEQLEKLIETGKRKTGPEAAVEAGEDYIAEDYSGGNFDDAYSNGVRDGETEGARELLALIGIKY